MLSFQAHVRPLLLAALQCFALLTIRPFAALVSQRQAARAAYRPVGHLSQRSTTSVRLMMSREWRSVML